MRSFAPQPVTWLTQRLASLRFARNAHRAHNRLRFRHFFEPENDVSPDLTSSVNSRRFASDACTRLHPVAIATPTRYSVFKDRAADRVPRRFVCSYLLIAPRRQRARRAALRHNHGQRHQNAGVKRILSKSRAARNARERSPSFNDAEEELIANGTNNVSFQVPASIARVCVERVA
jgi:hypothetical protein